jgi:hypothetical protein
MSDAVEVLCPDCQSSVPLEDVNVANDIALCRKCSRSFSFAEAVQPSHDGPVDLTRPPKGVWYKRTPNGFELGSSTRSAAAFFLVPFMLVWAGGSLGGIYGSQIAKGHFSLGQSLFGIPFLFGTILFGSFTIMTVCGKVVVRADGRDGQFFIGAGSIGFRKKFRWDEVKDIRLEMKRGARGQEYQQILIDADTPIAVPNVPGSRLAFLVGALRQLRRDFFPAPSARAVPPKISEAA